jgi:hypothetical protein
MKKYNITTVGTYQKDGQEKKTYPQVGKLIHFEAGNGKEESFVLELNMFPNTKFCVFPDTLKDQTKQAPRVYQNQGEFEPPHGAPVDTIEYPEEPMNPDDIPF